MSCVSYALLSEMWLLGHLGLYLWLMGCLYCWQRSRGTCLFGSNSEAMEEAVLEALPPPSLPSILLPSLSLSLSHLYPPSLFSLLPPVFLGSPWFLTQAKCTEFNQCGRL